LADALLLMQNSSLVPSDRLTEMILNALLVAGALLAIERLTYLWVWYRPEAFRRVCEQTPLRGAGTPVDALATLFHGFKAIQIGVFVGWCVYFGGPGWHLPSAGAEALAAGVILLVAGQVLNFSVFHRLGKNGVFYGNKLGREIPWQDGFPFSLLHHPQYVGTVISIWGVFLIMRFPHPDWIALPLLQTVYYAAAARLER